MYNNNNEFRSMKRAHSPDSFDPSNNNNFRGGHHHFRGGHHQHFHHNNHNQHHFNKRHRGDYHNSYQQPQTIEERISRLGDTGARNQEIGLLAKDIDVELANKSNGAEKIKNITALICKCIISFPTRIATYSTLIGLISVKHYNVSCQIVNSLQASYSVYLEAQRWDEALTIMHLLASLVNCKVIHPKSLLAQFEVLLQVSNEQSIPQTRSDYYIYTVMSSIPYVAQELSALKPDEADKLGEQENSVETNNSLFEPILTKIENYLNSRSKNHLASTRVWLSNDQTLQMDYLDSLWVQMKNFRANNWTETFLPRPYYEKEYKNLIDSSLVPQSPPVILVPEHSSEYVYPSPKIVFRIFDDDVTEGKKSIPGSDKIERFCIENHIRNYIDEVPNEARVCARHLSRIHHYESLPIKHLLIETILGELFALPKTKHDLIYYQIILAEFNKVFPISKNQEDIKTNYDYLLNEAVKVLYENLETMNVTCFSRFLDWFSFHLNNTEFIFPFITWADAAMDKEKVSAKAIFVQELLERCVRLSFQKKIETIIKVSLPDFIPPETKIKYDPVFSTNPNAEYLAETIKKLIIEKADLKTFCEALNIIIDGVELPETFTLKEEKLSDKLFKIDIFTALILSMASKSLTHLSSAIGKYKSVFKALINEEGGQVQLLQTMQSCLSQHPQLQVILVDKLLKALLIDAKEVCNWLFSESMRPFYHRSYPWEILGNTTNRLMQMIRKLEKQRAELDIVETPLVATKEEQDEPGRPSTPVGDCEKDEETKNEVVIKQEIQSSQQDNDVEMESLERAKQNEAKKVDLQTQIDVAKSNFNKLLLQIFTMFADNINDHIKKSEENGLDYKDSWYKWFTGRMQQIYYNHYDTIQSQDDILRIILDFFNYK